MKQFTLAFSVFTLLSSAAFAQDVSSGKILITCPSEKNIKGAGLSDQKGVSSVQYTPSFSIEIPSHPVIEYTPKTPPIQVSGSTSGVKFLLHSARFDGEMLTCAVRRDEGGTTQFLDFSISLLEINYFLAPKGYQALSCDSTSTGISCSATNVKSTALQ